MDHFSKGGVHKIDDVWNSNIDGFCMLPMVFPKKRSKNYRDLEQFLSLMFLLAR